MSLDKLGMIKLEVEMELEKFFDKKIYDAGDDFNREVLELLREYTLRGGKRIRSGMFVYGYGCFKELNDEIINAAMAMELIQSYLLIHDDIIDRGNLRRGKDSMHIMYEKRYPVNDKKHFGISLAICAGDLAACLANEILLNTNFEHKEMASRIMNQMIERVIYGQILDIIYEKKPFDDIDEEKVLEVYKLKSASYTVEGPLHIGAALAGANDANLKPLLDYGVILGKAFQIRDDINGIFGDETKTGKPNDSDLKQEKKTLLMIKTIDSCSEEEREFILNRIGNNLDEIDADEIRKLIRKYSLKYCEDLCDEYVKQAKNFIINAEIRNEGKDFLMEIAEFVAKRDN